MSFRLNTQVSEHSRASVSEGAEWSGVAIGLAVLLALIFFAVLLGYAMWRISRRLWLNHRSRVAERTSHE